MISVFLILLQLLGRHCYQFSCSPSTKVSILHHLIGGALQAGSMLLLQDSTTLQPQVVVSLGEWLATLMAAVAKAFSGKQSSIIFPTHSQVRFYCEFCTLANQLPPLSLSLSLSLSLPLSLFHPQQKNASDGHSLTSSFSTPHVSRTSTSMLQSHPPLDKTTTPAPNKSNLLKHSTTRALSVIISEQQLLPEAGSREGTASRQGTAQQQKDTTTPTAKEPTHNSEARDNIPSSRSPSASQHSLSRTQHHRHTAASTGHPLPAASSSSQPTTRIDWYRLCEGQQQQPSDSQSSISKQPPEWFGYGGGPRIDVEIFDKLLQVSPGFGCVFVGTSCISTVREIPESFKVR